ncbi:MAG: PD40 domain-containing protein [Myxococcaceae bacterium]|nr:PD40 domain-containing protein [Myxococcaceae bacterium]
MGRIAWVLVGLVVSAAALAFVLTSRAPAPSADGLCFVQNDQVRCLFDGAERALTSGPRAHFPAGVLDGRLLVMESQGEGDDHVERLLLVAFDGGVTELHGEARRARTPAVGSGYVVMESSRAGFSDLWRVYLDGGAEQLTNDGEAGSFEPQLLADGGVIHTSSRDGDPELYELGGRRLTVNAAEDLAPRVSPRGDVIVFVSSRGGSDRLYVLGGGGGEPKLLHAEGLEAGPKPSGAPREDIEKDAVFTPDGREVVFAARSGGGRLRIWAVEIATGKARALTDGAETCDQPAVSGERLAFVCGETPQLFVMRLDGGKATKVAGGWLPVWVR